MTVRPIAIIFAASLSILSIGLHSPAIADAPLSFDDIRTGLQHRAQKLAGARIHFQHSGSSSSGPASEPAPNTDRQMGFIRSYELLRRDNKLRFSRKAIDPADQTSVTRIEEGAWNGSKRRGYGYDPAQTDDTSTYSGTVSSKPGTAIHGGYWMTALEQQVFDLRVPLIELIDDPQWNTRWRIADRPRIDGAQTYLIESEGILGGKGRVRAWIDPARDFAPRRIEVILKTDKHGDITERMEHVKLDQRNGVWVIVDAKLTIHNPAIKADTKYGFYRFTASKYEPDPDITDDELQLEFPKGTSVWDDVIQTAYVAGEGVFVAGEDGTVEYLASDRPDHLKPLAHPSAATNKTTDPTPILSQSHPPSSERDDPNPNPSIPNWIWYTCAIGIGLIGVWVYRRHKPIKTMPENRANLP